eukprot:Colp12_sorted_trinity150504_noHs@28633
MAAAATYRNMPTSESIALEHSMTLDSLKSNDSGFGSNPNVDMNADYKLVLRKLKTMARRGTAPGRFEGPHGIFCADGLVYVCDLENDRIQVLSEQTGALVKVFEEDRFLQPMHITVTENYIVCVHSYDQEILSWISRETFNIVASRKAPGFGGFGGVCRAPGTDRIFVSLPEDNLVAELDHEGNALRVISSKHVNRPTSLFFLEGPEHLFICCEKTVEVFDLTSGAQNVVHTASYEGFTRPCGVCVDEKGNAIIADAGTSNIYLFDNELRLTTSYHHSSDSGIMAAGMAFDGQKKFWLSHITTGTLVKYDLEVKFNFY